MSYTSTGTVTSDGRSTDARIYGNGTGAVYQSTAALAPEDTNGQTDVYSTSISALVPVTSLVSKAAGVPGNGASERPSVNLDGTVVAFGTLASNLVTGDTNGALDAVIWDSHSNPPTLTLATGTVLGDAGSGAPDVSHDALGRFVVFVSSATNLVALKTNATVEAYVLDRSTGVVSAESRTEFGESPNGDVFDPSISADGARVSYESVASNLAPDANVLTDVLVRDRPSGLTEVASTEKGLAPANGTSTRSALSADGRYVAFNSDATNLVTPDANGVFDVFTRAAIVPQIYTVKRADLVFPLGHVESAPAVALGHEHGARQRAGLRTGRDGGPRCRDHDRQRPGLPDRHHLRGDRPERNRGRDAEPHRRQPTVGHVRRAGRHPAVCGVCVDPAVGDGTRSDWRRPVHRPVLERRVHEHDAGPRFHELLPDGRRVAAHEPTAGPG